MLFTDFSSIFCTKFQIPKPYIKMESTRTNAEIIKPVLLKAGIPIALSVAGFMYARIMAGKSIVPTASFFESHSQAGSRHEESFHSLSPLVQDDEDQIESESSFGVQEKYKFEDVLGLRSKIQGLEKREREIERQFLHYLDLKEQESALVELKNTLMLQIAYAEFMDREVSSMEAENKRFENLGMEYLKIVNQIEYWKSENGLLQKNVKRLARKERAQSDVIRENNRKIVAREAEILRHHDELETRCNVIKNLENEVKELRMVLDQFQEEKNDLLERIGSAEREKSAAAITKNDTAMDEDYNQRVNELEQLQKVRADEVKELIYLRWSNACLKHELMRNYENRKHMEPELEESGEIEDHGLESDHSFDVSILGHGEGYLGETNGNHICSKRRKLIQKFKRWVEGSEKAKTRFHHHNENHNVKCFGRHSVSDGAEEENHHHHLLQGRKSCSSA